MNIEIKKRALYILWMAVGLFFASEAWSSNTKVYLVKGDHIDVVENNTIIDFRNDLLKVLDSEIEIIGEDQKLPKEGIIYFIGTPETHHRIAKLSQSEQLNLSSTVPGARGGIWSKVKLKRHREIIVIGGSDVQGLQYAVYDYSHQILGVDPFEYWTGKMPVQNPSLDLYGFENRTINPPLVPVMCYFENDVDELANYRGKLLEYDWESYTELINSLVRIRYNAIQFFDMLGRPEFFLREAYQKMAPDYQVNLEYVEKMMDYAHSKGVKVQIDMSLGYQIKRLSVDESYCWSEYKAKWIEVWKYYFEETPIGKADIFSLRPRHQVWDWEYVSACGEDKAEVFNEVYEVLGKLIDKYNPEAQKIAICYHDGMELFNEDFNPPKDWVAIWSDDGYGDFAYWPKSTKGYDFGTYMHAGFWKNHTVHNPYPMKVDTVMKKMFNAFQANKYCQVNGQNFRPFLLNLEAYSSVCNDPANFNGEEFYTHWTERYFSKEAAKYAVESMKILHDVQAGRNGYVQNLWEVKEAISYLSNSPIQMPGKADVSYSSKKVEQCMPSLRYKLSLLKNAKAAVEKGLECNTDNESFYYSYVYLPVQLYWDLVVFEESLHKISLLKMKYEASGDSVFIDQALTLLDEAKALLSTVYTNSMEGDKNPQWENWYSPEIRRPNNGFPTMEMLEDVKENLNKI